MFGWQVGPEMEMGFTLHASAAASNAYHLGCQLVEIMIFLHNFYKEINSETNVFLHL